MASRTHSAAPALSSTLLATLVAACLVSLLSYGVRASFGLFTGPLSQELGLGREVYSAAIAIQNLCWGIAQPFAGYLTDRFGARRVLMIGGVLYAAGIAWLAVATTPLEITLSAGVLVGLGLGGASFTTAVAALGRAMPESHRGWALGIGTAAGSLGQFVVVPVTQAAMNAGGWPGAAWMLAVAAGSIVGIAWFVRGDRPPASGGADVRTAELLGAAFRHPSYVLLVTGFFVCGFQLSFVTTHLAPYLADKGLSPTTASWALAFVGLANVVGSYYAGVLGGRTSKKNLLAALYLGRALLFAVFLAMPLSLASVLAFGAGMGLLWLSTVPLTSGLVMTFFGTRYVATLFGLAFFSHQVGSFFGVYLGGVLYERTGSYDIVWHACVGLSVIAAVLNLPILERPAERFRRLAAT
jgi:MFS family permease